MELDPRLLEDVERCVAGQLGTESAQAARPTLASTVSHTLPAPPRTRVTSRLVIMTHPGPSTRATVTSPNNLTLNFRKLFVAMSSGALAATYLEKPWAAILSLLVAAVLLEDAATVHVGESEAAVVWAVHRHSDGGSVDRSDLTRLVNLERGRFGDGPLLEADTEAAVRSLRELRVLRPVAGARGRLRLSKWLVVSDRRSPA